MAITKTAIKTLFVDLYNDCNTGSGLSFDDFADRMADIFIYFRDNADVNTNLTSGTATATDPISGALPVIGGTSTGGIS